MVVTPRSRRTLSTLCALLGVATLSLAPASLAPARAHGDDAKTATNGLVPIAPAPSEKVNAGKDGQNIFDTTAPNGGAPADLAGRVGIDQNLDAPLPLDLQFKDETGKTVKLGDYFGSGKKPVMLTMLQLTCDQICSAQFGAMTTAFRDKAFGFTPGKEFEVLTVSIDPKESPMIAQDVQTEQLKALGNPAAKDGWHFLTGDEKNTKALAKALGIKYIWEAGSKQYIHPDGIVLATPDGHISRYFMRLDYQPRDLRYSVIEASKERIGTFLDQIALSCFHYNPSTGKYSFQVMAFLRIFGAAFVLGTATAIGLSLLREKRRGNSSSSKTSGAPGVKTA